jgi:CBS domain-containing protein
METTTVTKEKSFIDLLDQLTAADLMTSNQVSIRGEASVGEAAVLFTDRAISGAAVIDDRGQPIGVLNCSDLLIHDREKSYSVSIATGEYSAEALSPGAGKESVEAGYQIVNVDGTKVSSIMTPVVFSVAPESSARKVMEEMVSLHVHRLFVIDKSGVLVGVISALDVVKGLLDAT